MKKKICSLLLFCFISLAFFSNINRANASIFPIDAKTIFTTVAGNQSIIVIATSTNTILAVNTQQQNTASLTEVACGYEPAGLIAKNYAKDLGQIFVNYVCIDKPILIIKSGNDESATNITYVPYNIASSTPYGTIATTTTMNTNIETIGYTATTTNIASGIQFTQAEYSLPAILYAFIFSILIIIIIIAVSYFNTRKKNDA